MTQRIILDEYYKPFGLGIAAGPNRIGSAVFKYGFNATVSTSNDTIWFQEGAYTWSPAASTLSITSSDAADDSPSGTGALTVRVEGLDADYVAITEDVVLNGTAVVNTDALFLRTHRMYVLTAGTTLTNEGVIYATDTGDTYTTPGVPNTATLIRSTIGIGEGQTLQAFYTVPAGFTAYMTRVSAGSVDGTNATTITLRTRTEGGAFRTKQKFIVFKGSFAQEHNVPLVFAEKTDIEMLADSAAATTDVAADFDLILIAN